LKKSYQIVAFTASD
jgi:CTD small phosphatase-like protein 2